MYGKYGADSTTSKADYQSADSGIEQLKKFWKSYNVQCAYQMICFYDASY